MLLTVSGKRNVSTNQTHAQRFSISLQNLNWTLLSLKFISDCWEKEITHWESTDGRVDAKCLRYRPDRKLPYHVAQNSAAV